MKTSANSKIIYGNTSLRIVQSFSRTIAYYTNRAGRPENQDGLFIVKAGERTVLAVADGIGGNPGGMEAAQIALQTLEKGITAGSPLQTCFEEANQKVLNEALSDKSLKGMGTTLAAAEITGNRVKAISCGDSPIFLVRNNREIGLLTLDHTTATDEYKKANPNTSLPLFDPANYFGFKALMVHLDARYAFLTSFIGAPNPDFEVLTTNCRLDAGDRLLLCTDGLTNYVYYHELADILGNMSALEKTITVLNIKATIFMYEVIKYGGMGDNITMILAQHGA